MSPKMFCNFFLDLAMLAVAFVQQLFVSGGFVSAACLKLRPTLRTVHILSKVHESTTQVSFPLGRHLDQRQAIGLSLSSLYGIFIDIVILVWLKLQCFILLGKVVALF